MRQSLSFVCALALALGACTKPVPKLGVADVKPALDAEAKKMKADGEKMPDGLGVRTTWTVVSVDVVEQPGNETKPFKGVVKFKIESSAQGLSGQAPQVFEKKFDYVYSTTLNKWLFGS
jgi:hypothetical protein